LADLLANMSLSRQEKWQGIDRELNQIRQQQGNKRLKEVIKEKGICLSDCKSYGASLKQVLRKQNDKRANIMVVKEKKLKSLKKCLVHL